MTTVLRLSETSFGQTGRMYSRLDEVELPSSPPKMRKGFPSTTSCVDVPCLRRCGREFSPCALQTGVMHTTNMTQAMTVIILRLNSFAFIIIFYVARRIAFGE